MSGAIRAGGKMIIGTALGQVIGILALPIIARFYPPSEFGIYSAWLVPVGLAVIVVNLQFHHALVLPKLESHAVGLFSLAQTVTTVGALVLGVSSFLYLLILGNQGSGLYVIPLSATFAVFWSAMNLLLQGMAIRRGKFGLMAGASLLRTLIVVTIQLLLGNLNMGAKGLLMGFSVGEACGAFMLGYCLNFYQINRRVRRRKMWRRALLRRYDDFLRFSIPMEFLNSASQGLPVILMGLFFGQSVAGSFAFAMRVTLAPVQLITNSLRPVAFKRLADSADDPHRQLMDFKFTVLLLGVVPVFVALVIAPFLADIFALTFGQQWREAGEYAVFLVFWAALLISNMPATLVYRVLRKQQWSFRFNVALLAARFAVLAIGGCLFDAYWSVVGFSFVAVIANVVYIISAYRLLLNRCTESKFKLEAQ